jgi:murein DD-endopeptidase MepM/ murein hydrolase activator NlpD
VISSLSGQRLLLLITVVVCAASAGLLFREYMFFKKQVAEMIKARDDYNNYVYALKRIMIEYERFKDEKVEETIEREKKKSVEDEQFLIVNRERAYLEETAIAYAKEHNLDRAVRELYAIGQDYPREKRTRVPRPSARSARRRSTIKEVPPTAEMHAALSEAVFHWPIPTKHFWISSPYGPRKRPGGVWEFHHGLDLAAIRGTLVYPAAEGVVIEARYARGYGNTIVIMHNRKFKTRYAHLDKILVSVGEKVTLGKVIGKVGDTGLVRKKGHDASHLHFEVYVFGKRLNPLYFMV